MTKSCSAKFGDIMSDAICSSTLAKEIKGREQDEDEKDETLVDVEEKKMTLPESIIILATLLLAFNLSQFCRNAVLRWQKGAF